VGDRDRRTSLWGCVTSAIGASASAKSATCCGSFALKASSTTTRASYPAACASLWNWPARWPAVSDVLLMDEPFSALDYLTRLRMRNELARLLSEMPRTAVLVTHDIEEAAQLADRIVCTYPTPCPHSS